eukprot:gnl/Dysnectes_brevis/2794_a3408_1265.p1 GENE.gnl/Dysnectes_brevis/2794_a3408_1265~~gnl/Dysnectes_brevis/2794_a3408_1265.p1  ORF type:complete len:315 (+),score=112.28 gnl/Dysnectes_brevis/2794_a3408_1265:546-1490(+)
MTQFLTTIGCYSGKCFGFKIVVSEAEVSFESLFIVSDHSGSIRSAAITSNKRLLTGGADNMMRIYNLNKLKSEGVLDQHTAPITSIKSIDSKYGFEGKSLRRYLVSSSKDGAIALWRVKDWECALVLKGHRGEVNDVQIHPSGRALVSAGEDGTVRLWSLLNGNQLSKMRLGRFFELRFNASGSHLAALSDSSAKLIALEGDDAAPRIYKVAVGQKLTSLSWVSWEDQELLAVGDEEGRLHILEPGTMTPRYIFPVASSRVKVLMPLGAGDTDSLVLVSSDGEMMVVSRKDEGIVKRGSIFIPDRPICGAVEQE